MAPSRRRKRAKQESDDDGSASPAKQGGPSTATAAAPASALAFKRRRIDVESQSQSSVTPAGGAAAASSIANTATSTPNRSRRPSRARAQRAVSSAKELAIKVEDTGDGTQLDNVTAAPPKEAYRDSKVLSDTSTLSAVSDSDVVETQVTKQEELDDAHESNKSTTAEMAVRDNAQTFDSLGRKYTRAEKGKGRAQATATDQKLQEEAANLREQLANLKRELTEAHTVSLASSSCKRVSILTCPYLGKRTPPVYPLQSQRDSHLQYLSRGIMPPVSVRSVFRHHCL